MELLINPDEAFRKNRLVGIQMVLLTLRLRDNWSRMFGDAEALEIGLAIVAIGAERLTRVDLDDDLKSLSHHMPTEALTGCNISSIAAATGLNRETARRKVERLIAEGKVVRDQGKLRLAPGFTQREIVSSIAHEQLNELHRTANSLLKMGALTVRASTPAR